MNRFSCVAVEAEWSCVVTSRERSSETVVVKEKEMSEKAKGEQPER